MAFSPYQINIAKNEEQNKFWGKGGDQLGKLIFLDKKKGEGLYFPVGLGRTGQETFTHLAKMPKDVKWASRLNLCMYTKVERATFAG